MTKRQPAGVPGVSAAGNVVPPGGVMDATTTVATAASAPPSPGRPEPKFEVGSVVNHLDDDPGESPSWTVTSLDAVTGRVELTRDRRVFPHYAVKTRVITVAVDEVMTGAEFAVKKYAQIEGRPCGECGAPCHDFDDETYRCGYCDRDDEDDDLFDSEDL